MPRFITNRWWTFILALVLGLSLALAYPAHDAHAAKLGNGITGSGDGLGGGLPPPGNGDPDVPIGKTSALKPGVGSAQRPVTDFGMRAVGDSRVVDSALMWRLQVVMRALKGFYFHL